MLALSEVGSKDHVVHAGATLALMSDHAKAGNLDAMSRAAIAHFALYPADRNEIVRSLSNTSQLSDRIF